MQVPPRPQVYSSRDYPWSAISDSEFKTELCKNFELQGSCRWGDTCCYAHGPQELRNKTHLNANYKSKICKHFHGTGACPYGLR